MIFQRPTNIGFVLVASSCALADYRIDGSDASGCAGTSACFAAAPSGWLGPVMVYDGNPMNMPACPENAMSALDAHHDLHADPAVDCGCACKPTSGCTWQLFDYGGSCSNQPSTTSLNPGDCIATNGRNLKAHAVESTGCATATTKPNVPAVRWDYATRACRPMNDGTCPSDAVCLPQTNPPFDAKYCVIRDGDTTCPGAPYSSKRLTFRSVADARSCQCNCGSPSGCAPTVTFCTDNACTNAFNMPCSQVGTTDVPCQGTGGAGSYWHFVASPITCMGVGFSATGQAAAADPVTVCCAP